MIKGSFAIALTLELIGLKRPKTMNPCRAWTDGVSSLRAFVSSSFFLAWAVNFIVSSFVMDIGATWVVVGDYLDEIFDARLLQAKRGARKKQSHVRGYCKQDTLLQGLPRRRSFEERASKQAICSVRGYCKLDKDFLAARLLRRGKERQLDYLKDFLVGPSRGYGNTKLPRRRAPLRRERVRREKPIHSVRGSQGLIARQGPPRRYALL